MRGGRWGFACAQRFCAYLQQQIPRARSSASVCLMRAPCGGSTFCGQFLIRTHLAMNHNLQELCEDEWREVPGCVGWTGPYLLTATITPVAQSSGAMAKRSSPANRLIKGGTLSAWPGGQFGCGNRSSIT